MAFGLDIGHRWVTGVGTEGSGKSLKVSSFLRVQIPPYSSPEEQYNSTLGTIAALLKAGGNPSEVQLNLNAAESFIREFTLPSYLKEDQISKVVQGEAEVHLHGMTVDDFLLDYRVVEKTENGYRILAVAASKKMLRQKIQMIEDAGLDVPQLGLDVYSLMNALSAAGQLKADETALYLDLGAEDCKMILTHKGQVRALRSAKVGCHSVIEKLAADSGAPVSEVEKICSGQLHSVTAQGGGAEGGNSAVATASRVEANRDTLAAYQREYLEKVAQQVMRTLLRIPEAQDLACVYVCGGGSKIDNIENLLGDLLQQEVKRIRVMETLASPKLSANRDDFDAFGLVALGTALKGVSGMDLTATDFRRGEFVYEKRFAQVRSSLMLCCFLLTLLFSTIAVFQYRRIQGLEPWEKALLAKQEKLWNKAFEGMEEEHLKAFAKPFPNKLGATRKAFDKIRSTFNEAAGAVNASEKTSALDVLREFLAISKGYKFNITRIELEERNPTQKIYINFLKADQNAIMELKAKLDESGLFVTDPQMSTELSGKPEDEVYKTTFKLKLKKKE